MPNPKAISVATSGRPSSTDEDAFRYSHRVPGVLKLLDQCSLPFVISVEGEWGRGKSTLLRMVSEALISDSKWAVVQYHPWRYDIQSFDDAWESLVEVIDSQLSGSSIPQRASELAGWVARNRVARLLWRVGLPAASLVAPGAKSVGEALSQMLNDPPDLERGFLVFERAREELAKLCQEKPLLILVDDLDRCAPKTVSQVLRCISTLFDPANGPQAAFLIAMDLPATVGSLIQAESWSREYALHFLEKIVNVHVTLPIVGIGEGDREQSKQDYSAAIRGGGAREHRKVSFPRIDSDVDFELPDDRIEVIVRFMRNNPRGIERFCILFDLKWWSRFEANATVYFERHPELDQTRALEWLIRFRDRLLWEALIELRWPEYDAKVADADANKTAIQDALRGNLPEPLPNLPCGPYLQDPDFLELHRLYFQEWSPASR